MSTRAVDLPTATGPGRRTNKAAVLGVTGFGAALAVGLLLFAATLPDANTVTTLGRANQPAPTATTTTAPTSGTFAYQPLWPFGSLAQAAAWQVAYRANAGYQPWHLNPGVTALSFARGYLGYNDLNKVFNFSVSGVQAWVGIGYEGAASPAGTVHLARMGTGRDAPWEVVGTRDSTLTIAGPEYGAQVASPLTVGGRITGTNETMKVQLRGPDGLHGQTSGIGASGATWSAQVAFTADAKTVLTLAVSSGGHVRQVERFAVTGVVARTSSKPVTDVDGDGKADTVRLVQPDSVRVDYGSGRVDVVAFSTAGTPVLLGAADADKDGAAEVFVRTGSGAAGSTVAVLRYVGGRLRVVTLAGQQLALTTSPATARQRSTWACGSTGGAILTWSGAASGAGVYAGLTRSYTFVGAELVQASSLAYQVKPGSPAPAGCGGIRQS
jgi:hypothetical protein